MNTKYYILHLLLFFQITFFCQKNTEISIKSITQEGSSVSIDYNLKTKWYIKNHTSLYAKERESQSWGLPLDFVVGDFGSSTKSGKNNMKWQVTKSRNELLGEWVFKIHNTMSIKKNIKNLNRICTLLSFAGLGIGGYYLYKSDDYYNQYQNSTTNAALLRQKDEESLEISFLSFSVGTVFLIQKISLGRKIRKFKNQGFD